jgi:hypothetical protein
MVGIKGMLSDIIRGAVALEPDIAIVESAAVPTLDLGSFTRRHRIDVLICHAADADFTNDLIDRLLHSNPRLGLVAIDGADDSGVLHRLVPAHDRFAGLRQSSLIDAIRAGAAIRVA